MSPERQLDANAVVIGKGAAVPAKTILRGAANTVLTQTVVNDEPAFTQLNLATMVTGSLPIANGGSGAGVSDVTYGPTIGVPNAAAATWFIVVVTDAAAHAVPAPINGTSARMITLSLINNTGGAIATATFDPVYHLAPYVAPAAFHMTSACLLFLPATGGWYQVAPWATIL